MLYPGKERTSEKCFSIHLTLPFLFEFIRQISEFVSKQNISGISQESAVLQSCRDCKILCTCFLCGKPDLEHWFFIALGVFS